MLLLLLRLCELLALVGAAASFFNRLLSSFSEGPLFAKKRHVLLVLRLVFLRLLSTSCSLLAVPFQMAEDVELVATSE